MLIQPQLNNTDSTLNNNNTDTGVITAITSNGGIVVQRQPAKESGIATVFTNDSLQITTISEKTLFTIPYRCKLNRDSLKAEMRKVVLEIDTIPKGLSIIVADNLKDTSIASATVFSKGIFTHHFLQTKNIEPKPKVSVEQNWMAIIILVSLFLIAILRVFYQKKFTLFVNAFISRRFSNQIIREENALTQSTSVVLSVVFLISISMFFYLVTEHFHQSLMGFNDFQKFSMILVISICFYFLKLLSNKLGGFIFKVYKETDEYIFNQFIVLQILGLFLTICCILLNYSVHVEKEIVIYIGFSTLILGFIIRMIKSIGIANMNTYSPVYIFLYLCTLEILPLIIIVKLIIR